MRRFHGINLLLWCHARFFGAEHDGSTVRVIRADIEAVIAPRALESNPNIRLHLLENVAEM